MKRLIPSQIKEESTLIRSLTVKDVFILILGVVLIALTLASSLPLKAKLIISASIAVLFIVSVMTFDMVKGYKLFVYGFLFLTRKRTITDLDIEKTFELEIGETIKSNAGYCAVVQLHGIDFGILEERTQDDYINIFTTAVKEVKNGKLIKLEKPLDLTKYIDYNQDLIMKNLDEQERNSEGVAVRNEVLSEQTENLQRVTYIDRIDVESYYFVVCDSNEDNALGTAKYVADICRQIGLAPELLSGRMLKLFLKLFFNPTTKDYNERDEEQGSESDVLFYKTLKERTNSIVIDGQKMRTVCLGKYPYFVGNAWAHDIFSLEGCRVVFNFGTYTGKNVNKVISKSMTELRSRLNNEKLQEHERMAYATSYNSLETLLEQINYSNEELYYTELYLMYPVQRHREIMKAIRQKGIKVNDLVFTQQDGWLSMIPFLPMPQKDNRERYSPIQSSTIAGAFPYVSKQLMDDKGSFLGFTSRFPAFFNQFLITDTRVNHNMVVLGKSGGGKSFFLKKTLLRASTEGKKIYVLDPDNEYEILCNSLHGNWIDVGGETSGRVNPLQVFPSLRDGAEIGDVSSHRLFLSQFFRTVNPEMSEECVLFLNKAIAELYRTKNISDDTNLKSLKPSDFPIFDDFRALLQRTIFNEEGKYDSDEIAVYKKVLLYIEQYADGGLYSRMWNGYTTLEIDNDFNVLNFQSLFANNNRIVANGQMLLLMRFLNQEVIKNREVNNKSENPKEIMIVIDEAHRFINPQFPVALEFMSTMGKQIRKYTGSLTVATQNIDDFIGVSADMKAQASAVINACQYSMIFGLFADDVNKVKELYANYNGGLTQNEVDYVTKARRGDALFILDINTRLPIHISVFAGEDEYFEARKRKAGEKSDVAEELVSTLPSIENEVEASKEETAEQEETTGIELSEEVDELPEPGEAINEKAFDGEELPGLSKKAQEKTEGKRIEKDSPSYPPRSLKELVSKTDEFLG